METPTTHTNARILVRGSGPVYDASLMDAENNPVPASEVRFGFAASAIEAGYTLYPAAESAVTVLAEKDSVPLGVALPSVPRGGIVTNKTLPHQQS